MQNATFCDVLHEEKSHKQTLERAQNGLEISFKERDLSQADILCSLYFATHLCNLYSEKQSC